MTTPRARRAAVPTTVPAGTGIAEADYASAFELQLPDARLWTPEQWARATFEGAPALLRRFLVLGWTLVLGLRLGPRPSAGQVPPGHVLGWPVNGSGPGSVTLAASSRLVAAENIVVTHESGVTWVTVVRFAHPIGRVVWAIAAPVHHLTVPRLLGLAGRTRR